MATSFTKSGPVVMRHIFELTTSQFGNANSVPRLDFIWRVFGTKFPAEVAKIVVHILGFFKIIPFKVKLLWKLLEKIVIFNWNIWSHCNGKFWIFYFSIETSGHTAMETFVKFVIFNWNIWPHCPPNWSNFSVKKVACTF